MSSIPKFCSATISRDRHVNTIAAHNAPMRARSWSCSVSGQAISSPRSRATTAACCSASSSTGYERWASSPRAIGRARDLQGIETVNAFFNAAEAGAVRAAHGSARAIVANNVLAHVDDPLDFLIGCRELVDATGIISIEVPYVGDLLEKLEYDTVYHEHLCYFSIASLLRACEAAGLSAIRIDRCRSMADRCGCICNAGRPRTRPPYCALAETERRAA